MCQGCALLGLASNEQIPQLKQRHRLSTHSPMHTRTISGIMHTRTCSGIMHTRTSSGIMHTRQTLSTHLNSRHSCWQLLDPLALTFVSFLAFSLPLLSHLSLPLILVVVPHRILLSPGPLVTINNHLRTHLRAGSGWACCTCTLACSQLQHCAHRHTATRIPTSSQP